MSVRVARVRHNHFAQKWTEGCPACRKIRRDVLSQFAIDWLLNHPESNAFGRPR